MITNIIIKNLEEIMPGYDTHYIFGIHSYRRIPDLDIKKYIDKSKGAYKLGLLGPDIFFYYATEIAAPRKNIGSYMHTKRTDLFFKNCIEYIINTSGEQKYVATSYLCGFLSHYVLDCNVHPFIYWMTNYTNKGKDYLEKHFSLETDIDVLLLKTYLDKNPQDFFKNSELILRDYEKTIIADMLYYSIRQTYPHSRITRKGIKMAIISVQKEHKMLHLLSSKMKNAIGTIETAFVGQKYIAPLIPGGSDISHPDPFNLSHSMWFNPWNTAISSTEAIPDLLNKSREAYLTIIFLLDNFITNPDNEQALNVLMKTIGSKSYHSGLNWKIPS